VKKKGLGAEDAAKVPNRKTSIDSFRHPTSSEVDQEEEATRSDYDQPELMIESCRLSTCRVTEGISQEILSTFSKPGCAMQTKC